MHSLICIIGLVSVIIVFACSENSTREVNLGVDSVQAFQDTMMKWEHYMESSSEGLWEDSTQYALEIERIHTFGGEDNPNPQFYRPYFVHIVGDTLLISDDATQTLVCMDTTGVVLWKFGEAGEGPGYFAGIGQVDVCGDTIAVINENVAKALHSTTDSNRNHIAIIPAIVSIPVTATRITCIFPRVLLISPPASRGKRSATSIPIIELIKNKMGPIIDPSPLLTPQCNPA